MEKTDVIYNKILLEIVFCGFYLFFCQTIPHPIPACTKTKPPHPRVQQHTNSAEYYKHLNYLNTRLTLPPSGDGVRTSNLTDIRKCMPLCLLWCYHIFYYSPC